MCIVRPPNTTCVCACLRCVVCGKCSGRCCEKKRSRWWLPCAFCCSSRCTSRLPRWSAHQRGTSDGSRRNVSICIAARDDRHEMPLMRIPANTSITQSRERNTCIDADEARGKAADQDHIDGQRQRPLMTNCSSCHRSLRLQSNARCAAQLVCVCTAVICESRVCRKMRERNPMRNSSFLISTGCLRSRKLEPQRLARRKLKGSNLREDNHARCRCSCGHPGLERRPLQRRGCSGPPITLL